MRELLYATIFIVLAAAPGTALPAGLQFHWEDDFTAEEKAKLIEWIEQTDAAMTSIVGPLPFTKHIFLHRRDNSREPVPWAHTQRGARQGVHFHVDPRFELSAFTADWTAPHELSHLIMPYLGKGHAWFAEGFASFMQYQVMGAMGVLDEAEIEARYTRRFQRAERNFAMDSLPFAHAAPQLRASGQYPTMYWGGAIYFWQVDQWLRDNADSSLVQTLRTYVNCCRKSTRRMQELMAALDRIARDDVFSYCLAMFRREPGFPDYREDLIVQPAAG